MFRLHLESRRVQAPAFHLDEAAWKRAADRHPALAAQVRPSFGWDGENLAASIADADGLLASRFDKPMVNAIPGLRWIHTTAAGVDALMPLSELRDDIILSNSSGIHGDKAGESALMGMLMLNARMPDVIANQAARRWTSMLTGAIAGKRLLLLGFGDIGQAIGRKALALGIEVAAVTRSGRPVADLPEVRVEPSSELETLLPDADFLVITAPLTAETRGMMSADRLRLLPDRAGIINMARSAIVDYDALAHMLRGGRFVGAMLDVFPTEPLPADSPYWDVPRLLVTPHLTCDAPDYGQRVLDVWFDNFARLQKGEPLHNQVDRSHGY